MNTATKRVLWKGAITFGLVHIPIALHSASTEQGLNFDWLDRRSMDPVGYKRINKRTGKEVSKEDIVKGIEYADGQYVILSSDEIAAAYPKSTQTIEIETFVAASEIPFVYLERPYYVSPINKGEKVYALLREVLRKTGKVGIAKVVIQTKQHLALLVPSGPVLVLNLLRWGGGNEDGRTAGAGYDRQVDCCRFCRLVQATDPATGRTKNQIRSDRVGNADRSRRTGRGRGAHL